jgi:hypothetical protein
MGRSGLRAAILAAATVAISARASAQACCAGAGAVTPGRLAIHEDALVGLQLKTSNSFGSFGSNGSYVSAPLHTTEWEFEQDLFGALRVLPRGQLALLVPAIETYRRTPNQSSFGGGIGDINLSARYDFTLAGEARYIPGIAVLAGITFPTGKSIESADNPLGTDATGVGTYQANLGLAIEQTAGPWLFGITGLVAKRGSRTVGPVTTSLAAQWTLLASAAYTFPNDAAVAGIVSYAVEGSPEVTPDVSSGTLDATRRMPLLGMVGLYPFTDAWRLQGGLFLNPPISSLGQNTPAQLQFVLVVLRSWS